MPLAFIFQGGFCPRQAGFKRTACVARLCQRSVEIGLHPGGMLCGLESLPCRCLLRLPSGTLQLAQSMLQGLLSRVPGRALDLELRLAFFEPRRDSRKSGDVLGLRLLPCAFRLSQCRVHPLVLLGLLLQVLVKRALPLCGLHRERVTVRRDGGELGTERVLTLGGRRCCRFLAGLSLLTSGLSPRRASVERLLSVS